MSQSFDIAVIGATGTVGETIVQILEERDFPVGELHLLASAESAGSSVPFRGKNVRVREVDAFDFSRVRLAFFAAGPAVSLSFAPRALQAGCSVVDLSGAFPADQAPQVVPEINAARLAGLSGACLVASPSPSATALALVLAPLQDLLTFSASMSRPAWPSLPWAAKASASWHARPPNCSMSVHWNRAFLIARWLSTCLRRWARPMPTVMWPWKNA